MINSNTKYEILWKGPRYENSYEVGALKELYAPIISMQTIFFYFYLENNSDTINSAGSMEELYAKTNINSQDFLFRRRQLEAIGLLDTYFDEATDRVFFVAKPMCLPHDFFLNIILNGLLQNSISKEDYKKLKEKYASNNKEIYANFQKMNASINDVFSLDYSYDQIDKVVLKTKCCELQNNFNFTKFNTEFCKNSQFSKDTISDEERENIASLATLYGYNEKETAYMVIDSIKITEPIGSKVNMKFLADRMKQEITFHKPYKKKDTKINIDSETELANKINHYENTSPRVFLREKQNNIEPVRADLNLLQTLSENLGLSNGVINVLIDYCLINNDGELNRAYVEKIGATLIRKNITNSLDAINYLFNKKSRATSYVESDKTKPAEKKIVEDDSDVPWVDDDLFGD